ncbi:ATP-binding cassette, subfamily F, member 2 [Paragonimus westermani]|uniref:ATP-binding cassette, subfamily F, member 2 n=1 Tax=Paragonimus westermani TaxID=34504 RepID=A0A5J4NPL6_9TREM|nr:ATP-binding cassette, subfamily F, member 2 [Paragonimus westermani]
MPSDDKKKKALAKKEADKRRNQKKAPRPVVASESVTDIFDGTAERLSYNGTPASHADDVKHTHSARDDDFMGSDDEDEAVHSALIESLECLDLASDRVAQHRSVTAVLASHPEARDTQFSNLTVTFHGKDLLADTRLELNVGRRYGLIGPNGCGKSTLLAVIANRELPIPEHVDIFLLQREMAPSDKTALQCVMEVDVERQRLEKEASELALREDQESTERLMEVYERLEHLDADKAEAKAAMLLHGLGFTQEMQQKQVKHFSGGWRMRIALARALFVRPALLLLDEPTNHLDLNACVWLERELVNYPRCLVIISHSQDFLNGVCTNIILMQKHKLSYFSGNYDQYVRTRFELEENQMKRYKWEQDQISVMKDYIARFGHGTKKLARQAQSKEKVLQKMVSGGLAERVQSEKTLTFYFPDPGTIPPPVIQVQQVSFRYAPGKPWIYRNLDLAVDLDRRVALVGPNGAGKSTLLKLIAAEHLHEMLDINMTAVDWMMKCYPDIKERDDMRKILGRYGLSGAQQVCPIRALSDGQRCRIIFAWLAQKAPHLLLLDEPTNHLDIETIDSLADAIDDFKGGLLLVSHDFRLISQVAREIWVCENQSITRWEGDIFSYKRHLVKTVNKELARLTAENQ